ncbi:hypothetical protein CDAR_206461 [Caerostris darwini]|uniref:Uncharacterized protein n=1 Tax=Caerostris darwini TaxID=1538125 RepID=A0AAV4PEZ4_9ARAC|nr:hypothetical protein CDAR_206461 [Caerostris darwini]
MNTFRIPPHKLPNDRRACIPLSLPLPDTFACRKKHLCTKTQHLREREEIVEDIDLAINDRTPRFHIGIKMLLWVPAISVYLPPSTPPLLLLFIYRLIRSRISILGENSDGGQEF